MLKGLVLFVCAALLPTFGCAQVAEYLARQELESHVARLSDPLRDGSLATDAADLMAGLGLVLLLPVEADPAFQPFKPDTSAVIELVDIRLLLTRIAIQAGARDHAALIRSQGERDHDVILLRGGLVEFRDLLILAHGTAAEPFLAQTAEGLVLTRPLAIWDDAGLALGVGDTLVLDQASGSFVANLGRLVIAGGSVSGNASGNSADAAFHPFILTAGDGSFAALKARFEALGLNGSTVFGGLAVVNSGLTETLLPSSIVDSTVSDVASVAMVGTRGTVIAGNRIVRPAGTAILLSHATEALVAGNRLSGRTGPRAIRVTADSSAVTISGNVLSPGTGTGILVDGGSVGVTLSGNVILGSAGSGVIVRAADCISIAGNLVAQNAGSGISVADTHEGSVSGNAILFNQGSGILLRDQAGAATLRVSRNVFAGNRDGLHGATPGRLELEGNRLDSQLPRIFGGDLAPLTVDWLQNRNQPLAMPEPDLPAGDCVRRGAG